MHKLTRDLSLNRYLNLHFVHWEYKYLIWVAKHQRVNYFHVLSTISRLNSIPIKALSCVLNTPSPIPNMAAMRSRDIKPSTPLFNLNHNMEEKAWLQLNPCNKKIQFEEPFTQLRVSCLYISRSQRNTMAWIKAPPETIQVIDVRPEVSRPAATEHWHKFQHQS